MRRVLPWILILAAAAGAGLLAVRARPAGPPEGPPARTPAPDMEVVLYQGADEVGGSPIALSALWQRAPVVLNFWAALCPPCRAEMPDFQRLVDTHRAGRYRVIGVDIGPFIGLGSRDEARVLLRTLGVTYPAGTTLDARVVRAYGIVGMPTTVFIGPDGTVVRRHTGLLTLPQMRAFTDELLKASGAL